MGVGAYAAPSPRQRLIAFSLAVGDRRRPTDSFGRGMASARARLSRTLACIRASASSGCALGCPVLPATVRGASARAVAMPASLSVTRQASASTASSWGASSYPVLMSRQSRRPSAPRPGGGVGRLTLILRVSRSSLSTSRILTSRILVCVVRHAVRRWGRSPVLVGRGRIAVSPAAIWRGVGVTRSYSRSVVR